jgi:hypothetical protein
MKVAPLIFALLVWPSLSIPTVQASEGDTAPSVNQRTQNAIAVWQDYQSALRDGNEEKARACWTESARRYPAFDFNMYFHQAVAAAREDSLEIAEVKDHGTYIALHVTSPHWQETAWSGPPGRTYYVVHAPQALLANPVEVLIDGWQARTTRHFVCHYPKGARLTDDQAKELEELYSETTSRLGIGLDHRIDYFMCDSIKTVGALMASGPAAGRAGIENWIVAALGWKSFHEVVHVLIGQTSRRQPDSPVFEGAACFFGGATLITRDAQLAWAKALVENNEAMPLATLLDESGFWSAEDMNDPYAEAAAFTGFLIDRYGVPAYKTLYRHREDGIDSLEAALEKIYGKKVSQLETEWKDWLRSLDVPTVVPGIDQQATEILRVDDPSDDDNGDGHFTYPVAPTSKPGMFDLTGFRVLSDDERLYFEMTYRDLVDGPDGSDWGFRGTFTRIAVDCGGPGEEGPFSFRYGSNATIAGHSDYQIDVSDCGVSVVHGGRIAACLKRPPAGERLGDVANRRIRFSIPCSEPEESRNRWRYAVAVGGCADGGRHFKNSAGSFLTVGEHASEQTGGGGSADGSNPNVYDILLPAGQDQAKILAARPVVLPMVGL